MMERVGRKGVGRWGGGEGLNGWMEEIIWVGKGKGKEE